MGWVWVKWVGKVCGCSGWVNWVGKVCGSLLAVLAG